MTDKELLDLIEANCLSLRCIVTKCGLDDSDVGWEVVEHHFGGKEKLLGRGDTPREALIDSQRKPCAACQGQGVVETNGEPDKCRPCRGLGKI